MDKTADRGSYMELVPRYDARKSFNGKARVRMVGGWGQTVQLISYDTVVAQIGYDEAGERVAQVYNLQSDTTLRHVREFLRQNGFKAESKAQIELDYFVEV